jgi:hypothetical protein
VPLHCGCGIDHRHRRVVFNGFSMKTAAICLDNYKIPIFQKHLDKAGFKYEGPLSFTADTSILRVKYEWVHELKPIVEAAELEVKQGNQNG